MIYRERHPLEREAEQESVGWSTAAPARTEIDALKESLNDPSCGWNVYVEPGSLGACALRKEAMSHGPSRRF